MANISETVYEFLDKPGVTNLSKALLTKVNSRIQERIVTTLDESSDDTHIPSALAVYNSINKMSHVKFKTHMGSIDEVSNPNSSYIYLQRDNIEDKTWMMYIWQTPETEDEPASWIAIGDTEVDLSNYWSKDPADIEILKEVIGVPDEVAADLEALRTELDKAKSDITNLQSSLEELNNIVNSKVSEEQLVRLTDEEIISAIDDAFAATSPTL